MKTRLMETPWRDLGKQTPNFGQDASKFTRNLHQSIPTAFPKAFDWNKIQACTQKPDLPVHDYYNQLKIVFIENSGVLLDVESM